MDRPTLLRIANGYNAARGLPSIPDALPYVAVDRPFARRIADAYGRLPAIPSIADLQAYWSLRDEVQAQFRMLMDSGIRFTPFGDDMPNPYATSADMMHDLFMHDHLFVYNGGADHPALMRQENWQFRAVHDVFGHALHGYQFGPRGEENAYRAHRLTFTPSAVRALTTETRGQNSWVNFGPFSHLPPRERPYADQKAALLPEWCLDLN